MDGEPERAGGGSGRVSDEALVEAFYGGDEAAFAELYERCRSRLYALALRFGVRPQDASGRVQDTLVKFYETRAKKHSGPAGWFDRDKGAKFSTWLYRVHNNNCIDFLRRSGSEPVSLGHADDTEDGGGSSPAALVPSTDRRPDDLLVDAATSRAVRDAVAALPDDIRIAVELYYFWERGGGERPTQEQIGAVVGCSAPTVNRMLEKGRAMIKGILVEKGFAEPPSEAVGEVVPRRIGNAEY